MIAPRPIRSVTPSAVLLLIATMALGACTSSRPFVADEFSGWESQQPPARDSLDFRVFLAGETGGEADTDDALVLLRQQLLAAGEESAVVFLGGQVQRGLPDSLAEGRAEAEAELMRIVETVDDYPGQVIVIPGDEDAADLEALDRQTRFLRAQIGDNVFVPQSGLAGPVDLKLTDGLVLFALDTGWWLRDEDDRATGEVEGRKGDFEIETELDVLNALNELLMEYDDDRILVVGHHPMFSNGERGSHFEVRQHLFPLTDLWGPLYIPLPIVGSLYPLVRSYFPGSQDLGNEQYRELRETVPGVIEEHDGIIYAAAHEHGLQYTPYRTDALELQHHITSGSAVNAEPMASGFGAGFAHGHLGFASLQYYKDGTVWTEFWEPDGAGGRLAFRTQLEEPLREEVDPEVPAIDASTLPDYTDSTRVVAADPSLQAGSLKKFWLGDSYRDVWAAEVPIPVLDLGREFGGLTPVKRGGGYQTVSLRVVDGEGREHVLRQVRKRSGLLVPPSLRGTVAEDVFADQIQTTNPYGALVVPRLARAAGIYYATPQFRIVPDDPRLGVYREDFANTLVLFEERADDFYEEPRFGEAEDVDSSIKLFAELREDNDTRVDQPFYLRSRLFDLLIGDWDRHQDQWRWAQFEPFQLDSTLTGEARTKGKVYRPIPRDRDQVFFTMSGVLPKIAQRFVEGLQDFDEEYGDLIGLTQNALELDRRFLTELERSDWQRIAADLQSRMTDEVFREALQDWPEAINALEGERTLRLLQSRRDQIPEMAEDYYELMANVVDVVGSDKHERFVVERLSADETKVTVYKTNKKGENQKVIYERLFLSDETDEIRLYGLGGRDRFEITGVKGGPYIRAVGGSDEDAFSDATGGRRAHYYDTESGNEVDRGRARVTLDDNPSVNRYDPDDFSYRLFNIVPFFGYNATDGPFVGGGVTLIYPKFRHDPYGHAQTFKANVSTYTGAVNVAYDGHWVRRFDPFDAVAQVIVQTPQSIYNFYGFGNETSDDLGSDFYQVRFAQAALALGLEAELATGATVQLLPTADVVWVDPEEGTFLNQDGSFEVEPEVFAGGDAAITFHRADREVNPLHGFSWENRARVRAGVKNFEGTYATLTSDLSFFLSPLLSPQVTLALRAGGQHVVGEDFPFYDAATIGGAERVRGFRRTRFSGRTAAFQNAELRLKVLSFQTYAVGGDLGLIGFADNGRVWVDGEDSSKWHQGYGGGLWINLFDMIVASGTVAFSDDGMFVNVGTGFRF